jgi:hypothetical protein
MIELIDWNKSSSEEYFTKHRNITTIYNQYKKRIYKSF